MAIPIEDAVSACLNEMRKYYNCEKLVSWIFHKYFLALIRFYHARGIINYDKSITEAFLTEKERNLKSIDYKSELKLHILRLIEFSETGKINFAKRGYKKYCPQREENIRLYLRHPLYQFFLALRVLSKNSLSFLFTHLARGTYLMLTF